MAFTKPIFAVGLDIPNCNFQIPGDSGGLAAGWTLDSGTPYTYGAFAGSIIGHSRQQYIYSATPSASRILSAPSSPYHMTSNASTIVFGAMEVTDASTGNSVQLKLYWYDSAGADLGSESTLITVMTPASGLYTGSVTIAPPSGTVFCRLAVQTTQIETGTMATGLTFVGAGCWNGATSGYFQPSRYPVHPGTGGRITTLDPGRSRSEAGIARVVDRSRHARPNVVTLAFTNMPNTDRVLFEKLDALNAGRNWEVSAYTGTANPQGGSWPILLLPGMTGLPAAILCDMTSGLALEPDPEWGRTDPPYWQGALEFTERT